MEDPVSRESLEAELAYRREMEAALRKEIQHRRRVDKAARQHYQALAATLKLALEQPSLTDFTPALLRIIVRECDAVWVTLWHVDDEANGARRIASAYRSRQIGQLVESFARSHRKELTRLSLLYLSLSLDTRCTTIVKAEDPRVDASIRSFYQKVNVASVLVAPMLLGERLVGWIACLLGESPQRIASDRVAFLETVTHEATLVAHLTELASRAREMERVRESERLAREREQEASLIGRMLHSAAGQLEDGAGVTHLLAGMAENIRCLLDGLSCGVWVQHSRGEPEVLRQGENQALVAVIQGANLAGVLARFRRPARLWFNGREMVSKKIGSRPLEEALQHLLGIREPVRGKWFITLPLLLRERCLGRILVVTASPPSPESERWLAARALALQAGLVLQFDALGSIERKRVLAEERHRIARDMHDLLAQAFSGILLQLEALQAERLELPSPALSRLEKVRFLAHHGVDKIRNALSMARPALLDNHSLPEALAALSSEVRTSTGIAVQFTSRIGCRALDSKIEVHLFAIASEAIHNAVQHAHPTLIQVDLEPSREGSLQMRIRDNGGGDVRRSTEELARAHFGVRHMRERAKAIGARFFLTSPKSRGTTIRVLLPAAEKVETDH